MAKRLGSLSKAEKETTSSPGSFPASSTLAYGHFPRRPRLASALNEWPTDVPVPHASVEFEVSDVAAAAEELKGRGYSLIHDAKTEPWSQVTARLLTPDGLLIAVCYTPWFHDSQE